MTTLVTGATGFLGSHVARLLVERGDAVRLFVRPSSAAKLVAGLPAERVEGDIRDAASVQRALAGVETVYHVAADYRLWARYPREIYESNVAGTKNLLDGARVAGVTRFIYTSTVATVAVSRGGALPDEAHGHFIGGDDRGSASGRNVARRARAFAQRPRKYRL